MGVVSKPSPPASSTPSPASADVRAAVDEPQRPVEFVSEDDVRTALKRGEKIYVGPRTIITPSARDLGEPNEVFVKNT